MHSLKVIHRLKVIHLLVIIPAIAYVLFLGTKLYVSYDPEEWKRLEEQQKVLDSVMFLQIPRSMVHELEEPLKELETLFVPITGLNMYGKDAFEKGTDDRTLQYISNSSFNMGWSKELYFYEHEFRRRLNRKGLSPETRALTIRSNYVGPKGERGKRLLKTLNGTQRLRRNNWQQNSGSLIHRYIHVLSKKYALSHGSYVRDIKGLFYYPPGGFREWHTNMLDDTSWRLYYIHATEVNKSWFRYVPVGSNETVVVTDRSGYYNMFRLRRKKDELFWHSVYSDTNRFSIGFKIKPSFAYRVIQRFRGKEEK